MATTVVNEDDLFGKIADKIELALFNLFGQDSGLAALTGRPWLQVKVSQPALQFERP